MSSLADKISIIINRELNKEQNINQYRKPLVVFASAHDPLSAKMKELIGPHILHPTELLPQAKTVVAFFLPYSKYIVQANRNSTGVAKEWAKAYVKTNKLIETICLELTEELRQQHVIATFQKATHNFNKQDLTAPWSHRSAAYVAGLGTFGLNRMLITPSGCAGRFGSIIISAEIEPTPPPKEEYCLYFKSRKCRFCINNCRVGALTENSLDKQKCYVHLLATAKKFPKLGFCDVCGKCTVGPCALMG